MGRLLMFRKVVDAGIDSGHRSVFHTDNVTSGASSYRSYWKDGLRSSLTLDEKQHGSAASTAWQEQQRINHMLSMHAPRAIGVDLINKPRIVTIV